MIASSSSLSLLLSQRTWGCLFFIVNLGKDYDICVIDGLEIFGLLLDLLLARQFYVWLGGMIASL